MNGRVLVLCGAVPTVIVNVGKGSIDRLFKYRLGAYEIGREAAFLARVVGTLFQLPKIVGTSLNRHIPGGNYESALINGVPNGLWIMPVLASKEAILSNC